MWWDLVWYFDGKMLLGTYHLSWFPNIWWEGMMKWCHIFMSQCSQYLVKRSKVHTLKDQMIASHHPNLFLSMDINFVPLIFLYHKASSTKKKAYFESMESSQKDAQGIITTCQARGICTTREADKNRSEGPKFCRDFSGQLMIQRGGLSIGGGFIHVFFGFLHSENWGRFPNLTDIFLWWKPPTSC